MIHQSQWGIANADAVSWDKLEVSDPAYEPHVSDGIGGPQLQLRHVTVKTEHLYGRADLTLVVPEGEMLAEATAKPLPIVILLHGVYGSHWAWVYKGGAVETLSRLMKAGDVPPCILAMPSDGLWGDGSGYLRHQHRDYGGWIARDVPAVVRKLYPACQEAPLHLAGLSMGGFGALWLGALYGRSVFTSVNGLSSVTSLPDLWAFTQEKAAEWKLGDGGDISLLELIRLRHDALPAIRFDCGLDDPLLASNRELSQNLKMLGIGHVYEETTGGHDWEYWRRQLPEALQFLLG